MIRVSMGRIEGGDEMSADLMAELRKNAPRAVRAGRRVIAAEMKRLLSLRSGGPSAPGQPPAKVSGELVRAMKTPPVRERRWGAEAAIQVDHEGANRLEYGYRDRRGIETAPHPYAGPAIANKQDAADRAMEREL